MQLILDDLVLLDDGDLADHYVVLFLFHNEVFDDAWSHSC